MTIQLAAPDDTETIVMQRIPNDPQIDSPSPTPETTPVVTSTMTSMFATLSELSARAGDPISVDVSTILREVTVSLPSMIIFTNWCSMLAADETSGIVDALGTLATATIGTNITGSWTFRLHCHLTEVEA